MSKLHVGKRSVIAMAAVAVYLTQLDHAIAIYLEFCIGNCAAAGGIGSALCEIVSWFEQPGGIGAAIASLAVIFLGIGGFFGKVTWGTALTVAVGIVAIFSSGAIVSAITGGAGFGCFG